MEKDWKTKLANFFEELRIIQSSISETLMDFSHFCEFIAASAFECLSEELDQYHLSSSVKKIKDKSISLQISFPKSNIDTFYYIISLPDNSIELKLRLQTGSQSDLTEEPFMEQVGPKELLQLEKEILIEDIIRHYRKFCFESHMNKR
ncbi:MAG: hypothetical protein JW755_10035 [Candidatus Aminicenantes bacterium]|nr:hypothetical protein [Candidatus Aminicenantes bacterium]